MASVTIGVRVLPRSARDEVIGWQDDELRVRLRAPPVDGRANQSLLRLLADHLGVKVGQIDLVSGLTSRQKRVRIDGIDPATLTERLKPAR